MTSSDNLNLCLSCYLHISKILCRGIFRVTWFEVIGSCLCRRNCWSNILLWTTSSIFLYNLSNCCFTAYLFAAVQSTYALLCTIPICYCMAYLFAPLQPTYLLCYSLPSSFCYRLPILMYNLSNLPSFNPVKVAVSPAESSSQWMVLQTYFLVAPTA